MDKNRISEKDNRTIEKNKWYNKKLFQEPEDREKGINQIMGLEE